jgi:transcriptional regulator with XRE-family HTH domain
MLQSMSMPKTAQALHQLPPATAAAIEKLGSDLAVARLRRKESLRSWAQRMGVTVATLMRLEAGDPGVGIGIIATALWLIQRDGALVDLAAPEHDQGAIEMDVREAVALGRERAKASAASRAARGRKAKPSPSHPPVSGKT